MKTLALLFSGFFFLIASLIYNKDKNSDITSPSQNISIGSNAIEIKPVPPFAFEEKSLSIEPWMTDPLSWLTDFEDPEMPIEDWMTEPWTL